MKIEKLSDKQIRCILDKSDLADRHLKISELAYGTDKAKELFQEMMRQASYEFGFDAENIPLMIEAIPVSSECVVLVVTKVEDPEELDTRFSKFTPDEDYDFDDPDNDDFEIIDDDVSEYSGINLEDNVPDNNSADEVINIFNKVKEYLSKNVVPVETPDTPSFIPLNQSVRNVSPAKEPDKTDGGQSNIIADRNMSLLRAFSFDSIDAIADAASVIAGIYNDCNSLYKDTGTGRYYLILNKERCSPGNFNKVCNVFTEFGKREHLNYAANEFLSEHYSLIIDGNAVQVLATI